MLISCAKQCKLREMEIELNPKECTNEDEKTAQNAIKSLHRRRRR